MTIDLEYGDVTKLVLDKRTRGGFEVEIYDDVPDAGPLTMAVLSHGQVKELRDACDRLLELYGDVP